MKLAANSGSQEMHLNPNILLLFLIINYFGIKNGVGEGGLCFRSQSEAHGKSLRTTDVEDWIVIGHQMNSLRRSHVPVVPFSCYITIIKRILLKYWKSHKKSQEFKATINNHPTKIIIVIISLITISIIIMKSVIIKNENRKYKEYVRNRTIFKWIKIKILLSTLFSSYWYQEAK